MLARITSVIVAGLFLTFTACDSDDEVVPTDNPSPTATLTFSRSPTLFPSASPSPPALTPNPTAEPPALTPPTTAPALLEAIEAARTMWKAASIQSYQYDLGWSCFCGRPDEPIKIVVREGELLSVSYSSGANVTPGSYYDVAFVYATIDRVFQQIDTELQTPGRLLVEADFDPSLGFPTKIYSDSYYATDSGLYVAITNFEVLP